MTGVRQLADARELLTLTHDDPFVRAWVDAARFSGAWSHPGGAAAWVMPSRRTAASMHLISSGPADSAAHLAVAVRDQLGPRLSSVTLPRDGDSHLPPSHVLRPRNDWEWFATHEPPPVQPREAEVDWIDGTPDEEIATFLEHWSPRHDAKPGRPGVLRWCGARGDDHQLLAVAAHMEHVPGVPHLASIATSGRARGRGYGAAVTAWITRSILEQGAGWVTLGMYSDNDVARRMYHRLGYRCDHYLTSGGLVVAQSGTAQAAAV
jgi:ribosomal protein S18 acetylase RimI-like enzyme